MLCPGFTCIVLFIGARLRRRGVRIVLYIDDLLVVAIFHERCCSHVQLLLGELEKVLLSSQ